MSTESVKIREGQALYETIKIDGELFHVIVAKFGPTFTYIVKDNNNRVLEFVPNDCWNSIESLQQLLKG